LFGFAPQFSLLDDYARSGDGSAPCPTAFPGHVSRHSQTEWRGLMAIMADTDFYSIKAAPEQNLIIANCGQSRCQLFHQRTQSTLLLLRPLANFA